MFLFYYSSFETLRIATGTKHYGKKSFTLYGIQLQRREVTVILLYL